MRVFAHLKQVTKFHSKKRRALLDAALCGSGFLQITFDPLAGVPSRTWFKGNGRTPDMEAEFDRTLQQQAEQKGHFIDRSAGELRVDVVSPFQLYWDPNARSGGFDDSDWVARISYVPIERLEDRFGTEWNFQGDDHERGAALYEENIANLASGLQGQLGIGQQAKSQVGTRGRLVEFWEKPLGRNNGEGRYMVLAGKQVVINGSNPYAASGNPLPFVKYDWFPFEGRFIGLSLAEQLRPSQKAYNRARSHALEFQKTYGYAPVFLNKGGSIKAVNLNSMPGLVYEYEGQQGVTPSFGPMPHLPEYIANNATIAAQEMDEISAQASPTKSGYPAGVRSGAAIGMIQADNNAVMTPISHAMLETDAEAGTMMLQVAGLWYDTPRVARVLGDTGDFDPEVFMGTDLRGHYDLQVHGAPAPVQSREAYKQTLLDTIQVGALQPQTNRRHRALVMRAMQFETAQEILDTETRQETSEARILDKMIRDTFYNPTVMPFQDPQLRIPIIEHTLNSREFENLPQEIQDKLMKRWDTFKNVLAKQMQEMLEAQQAMSSGGGVAQPKGQVSQTRGGAPVSAQQAG